MMTTAPSSENLMFSPIWHMHAHQRLEDLAVVRDAEMQEFMSDDEILKARVLVR